MKMPQPQFADSAQKLLDTAGQEAGRLHHEYIGTEHLALALAAQTEGLAATTLQSLGINTLSVRETIEKSVRQGDANVSSDREPPHTSRTRRVFELAVKAANELGDRRIGAEHLLIGVIRERNGIGAQVLTHCGLAEGACVDVIKRLRTNETR